MAKSRPAAAPRTRTRASKRAATPPPLDLRGISRPASPPPQQKVAVLQMRTTTDGGGNGVTKKKSKKQLSRQQKERKAKALERAEAATEKLAAKREDSFVRARVAQSRRGNWEVLNEKMQEDLEEALVLATVQKPIENVK